MRKHGFTLEELKDLPQAVADPIAVFNNYQRTGNRTILTELHSQGKNIMVAVTLGKEGVDVDFNIVSSVFGKGENNIVDWINKGYLTYTNKEKSLDYLHLSESSISEASNNQELVSAANVVRNFENPQISDEENAGKLYRSTIESPNGGVARDYYERKTRKTDKADSGKDKAESLLWRLNKAYGDSMAALKAFIDGVLMETGNEMHSFEDAYKAENALSSSNKTQ